MATKRSVLITTLLPLALAAGACSTNVGSGPGNGDPYDPGGRDPDGDTRAKIAGTYEVRSSLDLDNANGGLAEVLGNIEDLGTDPAGTLMDILAANGNDLLDDLPSFLKDALAATINNYITSDSEVSQQLRDVSSRISSMVNSFEAVSRLEIRTPDEAGNATATHQLRAVRFAYDGDEQVIQTSNSQMATNISVNAKYSNNTLNIGAHEMSLPIGVFAAEALRESLEATDAGSLSGMLEKVIDCEAVAAQVGDIKIDTLVLVSQAKVEDLCGTGLTLAAAQVESQLEQLSMDMTVSGGEGKMKSSGSTVTNITGSWDFVVSGGNIASEFEADRK